MVTVEAQQEPRVSVIVVCTNELYHIRRCLPALLAQVYPSYEVIIVDNVSTDGSRDYVKALCAQDARLRLIENDANLGYVGANNVGFAHAQSDILVIVNPDTEPDQHWLTELVRPLAEPEVGLTTSKIVMMHDRGVINTCGNEMNITSLVVCRGLGRPATEYTEQADVMAVSGAAFAIRRDVLEQIGGFDPSFFIYYEDTDLSLRARLAGYRCVYVPTSIIAHDYVFKFSPKKAFWQERNRLYTLFKLFRWSTLIVLAPWLVLGELIALTYCAMQGPAHLQGKLKSYLWVLRNWSLITASRRRTQALRRVSDAAILHHLTFHLSLAGAASGRLRKVTERLLQPVLRSGSIVTVRLPW